jgi:aspartate racemase
MKKKTIGVLGGIGASASANFYQELVKICQVEYKAKNDDDFPPIIINSMSFSGFDTQGKGNEDKIKLQLLDGLNVLKSAGADFGIIVCNTVHSHLQYLQENCNFEIISIIDETIKEVILKQCKCVGILSSHETKDSGLYVNALAETGIKQIIADDLDQLALDKIIGDVISGKITEESKSEFISMVSKMNKLGADGIILGCTELPLAFPQNLDFPGIKIFNSNIIVAKAAIKKSFNLET